MIRLARRGFLRPAIALVVLLAAGATVAADERAPAPVLEVLGHVVTAREFGDVRDAALRGRRLAELAWPHVARDQIVQRGLQATQAELDEFQAHHEAFRRMDRARRARALEDVRRRLAGNALSSQARARDEDYRATLERLEASDATLDDLPPRSPEDLRRLNAPWIEGWKLNRELHRRYGGVVALTKFGPHPAGAIARLFREEAAAGRLRFHDPGDEQAFWSHVEAPPRMAVPPGEVDFTPFWRRPVVDPG